MAIKKKHCHSNASWWSLGIRIPDPHTAGVVHSQPTQNFTTEYGGIHPRGGFYTGFIVYVHNTQSDR